MNELTPNDGNLKWQANIHTIELQMLLKAISKDVEAFKDEIEKRRNEFEIEIDDEFPISPTECMNSPMDTSSSGAEYM